jgi:excisionase family DNA binding protein
MTELIPRPAPSSDDALPEIKPTPELLSVPEACDALRISKWSLYQLINSRRLRTVSIGTRRLVAREDLRDLLDRLRAEGDQR